jgi:hypothetical protein
MVTAGQVVLVLNAFWFAAGFWYFALTPRAAAALIIPRAERQSPLFATQAASLRFLGGMNLALAAFAVLLLLNGQLFSVPAQQALFAAVFALAHGSQFASNIPVLLRRRAGAADLWPVLEGRMRLIFLVDCVLMLANGGLAIGLLTSG